MSFEALDGVARDRWLVELTERVGELDQTRGAQTVAACEVVEGSPTDDGSVWLRDVFLVVEPHSAGAGDSAAGGAAGIREDGSGAPQSDVFHPAPTDA